MSKPAPSNWPWLRKQGAWVAIFACLSFVAWIRLRIADVPLERDEGEYAYAGQLILQGIAPYQLAYNMKFPGTYYAYSAILALFGQTAWSVHVGLLVVNAATIVLLFLLGRKLFGVVPGGVAAIAFAVLSLDRWIMGVFGHATHFVVLPAVAGALVLLQAIETNSRIKLVLSGALFGVAVLMKQQAFFFCLFAAGLVVWEEVRSATRSLPRAAINCAALAAGALLPFAIICLLFYQQGVLGRFWFWTFRYAKEYVSQVPVSLAWVQFVSAWEDITRVNYMLWMLAGAGALLLWLAPWPRQVRWRVTALFAASFLAVCPGFYFRQHYFILLLPASALLVGVAVASIDRLLARALGPRVGSLIALTLFAWAVGNYVVTEREYLFSMSSRDLSRSRYGSNPFVEAPEIARYVVANSTAEDRVAVLGSEPEIYFYANRKSATGYIYTYPLMEPQPYASRMQNEMIEEIETAHPKYMIVVSVFASWLRRPDSDARILNWAARYVQHCYDQVGVAEIVSTDRTEMRWGPEAAGYRPRSGNVVSTFRQKNDAACTVPH